MAYIRREICVSKSIELACSGKEIYHFCFVLLCIRGQIPSTSPPGGLYSEERFNGGFFALRFWGAYTWRGLFSEFYGMYTGTVIFGVESYLRLKTLQLKTCAENVLFLSWRTFFVGKYSI